MADFWAFDIVNVKWKLLSIDTENDGGPSPRSCHKMVFDTKTRQIFILGRYLERGLRDRAQNIKVSWLVKLQINLMEKSDISGDATGNKNKKNLPNTRKMKFTMLTSSNNLFLICYRVIFLSMILTPTNGL